MVTAACNGATKASTATSGINTAPIEISTTSILARMTLDGVNGVAFVVLAPNARRVSVVGDFNFWNARRHPMRVRGVGYWELFVPHAKSGDHYKFDIIGPQGEHLPLKSDPLAFAAEIRPSTASIVVDETKLPHPRPVPAGVNSLSAPISIYEVHLGCGGARAITSG